jgi:hypothetical protein
MNAIGHEIDPELVQRLLLARLLIPVKKPLSGNDVETAVAKAIVPPLTAAVATTVARAALEACEAAGYVTRTRAKPSAASSVPAQPASKNGPPRLTERGREVASKLLDVSLLPKNSRQWERARTLVMAGLVGYRPTRSEPLDADALAAVILCQHVGAPVGTLTTAKAVDRMAWRALGVERDTPFDVTAVQRYVLRDIVPENVKVEPEMWRRLLAMRLVGANKPDARELSQALLRRPSPKPKTPELEAGNDNAPAVAAQGPLQLADFARAVREAAKRPEVARYYEDHAFIGSVWASMHGHSPIGDMSLAEFKRRLVEAHQESLLRISRADLVGAMDLQEVERSEARFQNATFHFVVLEAGGGR